MALTYSFESRLLSYSVLFAAVVAFVLIAAAIINLEKCEQVDIDEVIKENRKSEMQLKWKRVALLLVIVIIISPILLWLMKT